MVTTDSELAAILAEIRQALATLGDRVAALEAGSATAAAPGASYVAGAGPQGAPGTSRDAERPTMVDGDAAIAPEILLVISAAVAAYLGERAHVRQVRLISSQEWGRQGRVNVQASHALHR